MSLDKFALAGVCFYYAPGESALYGQGGFLTGAWTQEGKPIKLKDGTVVTAEKLDQDGWFTYCTLEKPAR